MTGLVPTTMRDRDQYSVDDVKALGHALTHWLSGDDPATPQPKTPLPRQTLRLVKRSELPEPFSLTRLIRRIAIGIISVVILLYGTYAIVLGYFNLQWSPLVRLTAFIPYPIAVINFEPIWYSEWYGQVGSLRRFYQRQVATQSKLSPPDSQTIERHIEDRLITQASIRQLAQRYGLTITPQEIDQETSALIAEVGNQDAFTRQLQELYGWSLTDFQAQILQPLLLKQKVQRAIIQDDRVNLVARRQADQVATAAHQPQADFADLARRTSRDTTASAGGDLGYISRGQLNPLVEQVAFALLPSTVSDVIKTEQGYFIVKVEEKIVDDNGVTTQVHLRQIVILGKTIDDVLKDFEQNSWRWYFVSL